VNAAIARRYSGQHEIGEIHVTGKPAALFHG
jgi:hypothetical protein